MQRCYIGSSAHDVDKYHLLALLCSPECRDVSSYIGTSVHDADKYQLLVNRVDNFPRSANGRAFQHYISILGSHTASRRMEVSAFLVFCLLQVDTIGQTLVFLCSVL